MNVLHFIGIQWLLCNEISQTVCQGITAQLFVLIQKHIYKTLTNLHIMIIERRCKKVLAALLMLILFFFFIHLFFIAMSMLVWINAKLIFFIIHVFFMLFYPVFCIRAVLYFWMHTCVRVSVKRICILICIDNRWWAI